MRRLLIGALVVTVLAWAVLRVQHAMQPPPPPVVTARPDTVSTGLRSVRLWFAAPNGDSLVSEARDLAEAGTMRDRVAALVAELARGSRHGAVSAVPAGTGVLHVYLDERGLMTLDLSQAFAANFQGGTSAEYLAVASLVHTIGANLPEVKKLLLVCGGAPLATLGGHLPLDRPIDVSDWP
jgi:spore germination protein GerM